MESQVRQTLSQLNAQLADRFPYKLDMVDPGRIRLLDKNARYMEHETFQNLVSNVQRDGGLSSMPLCFKEADGSLLVLSGNHRVQAAAQAGVEEILVMVIDRPLSRQEQIAIQLSHNSLAGKDDMVILRELWQEMADVDLKYYAGLDSDTLGEIDKLQFETLSDVKPDFEQVVFQFLPEETQELQAIVDDVDAIFSKDQNFILARDHYDDVFDLLTQVKGGYNIVSNPAAMAKVMSLARKAMDEDPELDDEEEEDL